MSPAYAASTASNPITCANPGDAVKVFNAESLTTGESSQALALSPSRFGENTKYISVELVFSGAPGTFTIDVQEADTDADGNYAKVGTSITTVTSPSTVTAILDNIQISARFVRLHVTAAPSNSVTAIATITR